ncbi:MAG: hypothetical protein RJA10_2222, partial [Pseudomonadota bacterium]
MDLNFTADELEFRREIRQWVGENLPKDLSHKVHNALRLSRDDMQGWARILGKKGWLGWGWPKQFGGPGWSAVQKHLFEEECALAGAPRVVPFGPVMVAPVIMAFGSKAQQERFLPGIASGEVWWSQGYSEPGAGSDLAGLKTRAERKGDKYIVNGQKTWTTLGQYGEWIFCLVRTDTTGKPQTGISFLLIDMKTPGITVRPIILLDGEHEVNEVFFDNVEVPAENLIGEENKGWTYAKHLLSHERTTIADVHVGDVGALVAEQVLGVSPAFVFLADEVFHGHFDVVKEDFVDFGFTVQQLDGANGHAGALHVDQQEADARLRLHFGVGAHQAENPFAVLAECGPGFLAVDDVCVAHAFGSGFDAGQVRARTGLAVALAPPH